MVKNYVKPEVRLMKVDITLMTSSTQCDCYEYREHHGCIGCKGNCGCDHYDEETGKLIPGC